MIIKKFIAKTEKEAIENARKELGEGVVVMNVKPVKSKGLFAFLKSPMMEVTVALEEESEKLTAAVSAISSVVASTQGKEEETVKSTPVIETPEKRENNSVINEKRENNSAIEEKLDSLQSLPDLCLVPHTDLPQLNSGPEHARQVFDQLTEINPSVRRKIK